MKFGKYLEDKARPEWREKYLNYKLLKDLIKQSVAEDELGDVVYSPRQTSLTVVKGGTEQKAAAEERFFNALELEVKKVSDFTAANVSRLQKALLSLKDKVAADRERLHNEQHLAEAGRIGDEFLQLEKFVNLNYMGFHKILKKHDKMLPHTPCRRFYIAHLHQQPWVQGNYSGLLVQLSAIYSELRGDSSGVKNEDSAQGFVRSTTKYWVRTEDVSQVKHIVLQHLPVFQFNKDDFSGDAQLVNSVYTDNSSCELYHGRLDKKPGAIALRLRWYGPAEPTKVFVERKTHRESWKGEESVKERFVLPENKVVPFLEGEYTLDMAVKDLQQQGKSDTEIRKFSELFAECAKAIDSKQLRPMVRTQYMRTAFQIPFDSTVRISLDTNLVMIKENPEEGPSCTIAGRWYRDPSLPVGRTEITRFPHAVLEVKLSLNEGDTAPAWVTELIESGMLTEVHKFSKFIHGTCTLFPDMVQAVPYWVDDESVRPSMLMSAAASHPAAAGADARVSEAAKPRKRAGGNDQLDGLRHPLLGDRATLQLIRPKDELKANNGRKGFLDWWFMDRPEIPRKTVLNSTPMKVEPKTFFANERTFLSWLHMAVTIGSIACALLGFSGSAHRSAKAKAGLSDNLVEIIALILLPVAILMCLYALVVFVWRAQQIEKKHSGYIDDRKGPLTLAAVVVVAEVAIFIVSCVDFWEQLEAEKGQAPAPNPMPANFLQDLFSKA